MSFEKAHLFDSDSTRRTIRSTTPATTNGTRIIEARGQSAVRLQPSRPAQAGHADAATGKSATVEAIIFQTSVFQTGVRRRARTISGSASIQPLRSVSPRRSQGIETAGPP